MEKKTVLEHTRDSTSYQNHSSQTSGIQTFERGIQIENSVRNFLYHITLNGLYPGGTTMRKSQNPSGFNLGLKAEACLWFCDYRRNPQQKNLGINSEDFYKH